VRPADAEHLIPIAAAAAVFGVHDVHYALTEPYWLDESWVAVTGKFSLSHLPATTSSTPFGWSLLLRLFDGGLLAGGAQSGRILPLLFAAACAWVAYYFGRSLRWPSRWVGIGAGALCSLAALMSPAMLLRNDLKQYTADAFFAVAVLLMLSRVERDPGRRRLVQLGAVIVGGMLFSHTTAFVGAAALVALALVHWRAADRAQRRLLIVVAAATVAGMAAVYLIFDARAVVPGLVQYWTPNFIPHSLGGAWHFVWKHWQGLRDTVGLGPFLLAATAVVAGLITMWRAGSRTVALAIALLAPEMVVLSAIHRYPMFDQRTSTFLCVVGVVTAAVGAVGVGQLVAGAIARSAARSAAAFGTLAGVVIAVGAAAMFTAHASGDVNAHTIPREDVPGQLADIRRDLRPGDAIIVNLTSNWSFGYYSSFGKYGSLGPLRRTADTAPLQGYVVTEPTQPDIVVARSRTDAGTLQALQAALAYVRSTPGARIWLIRTHPTLSEHQAWDAAFKQTSVTVAAVGSEGLSVLTPP
jgi:hypothetical protein